MFPSIRLSALLPSVKRTALYVTALVAATLATPAHGQTTYTVNVFTDTQFGTLQTGGGFGPGINSGNQLDLRGALFAAMAAGGPSTIDFACSTPPCAIVLGQPLPPIFEATANSGATAPANFSLTIDGGSEGSVILDGNSLGANATPGALTTNRVFFVDNVAVTLKNLIIQNAAAQGGAGGNGIGGGGGAGFGAGLFVNQAGAAVTVQNTSFIECTVIGGAGGGANGPFAGGGGGLAYSGDSSGDGGGGVSGSPTNQGLDGGAGGGGGGSSITSIGGIAYAANSPGGNDMNGSGGAGGFGGGGGNGATGGFGGGGGGYGNGGFGGGGGGRGGVSAPTVGGISGGIGGPQFVTFAGGGGAAAGPAIFVANGSVVLSNVFGVGFAAQGGASGGTSAQDGTADATPVFNYGGTVNGSASVGPVANAFTLTEPVGQPSATQTATLGFYSSLPSNASLTIHVLTQGAPNLDFQLAPTQGNNPSDCVSGTAYSPGALCTVQYIFKPMYPGARHGAITLGDSAGNLYSGVYLNAVGTGPQATFSAAGTTINSLGGATFYTSYPSPDGVAVDAAGNVYVTSGSTQVPTIAKLSPGCTSSACVTPVGAGLSGATGLALDGVGNIYVADFINGAVKVVPPTCTLATCVITLGGGFVNPYGVAVDGAGIVYVTDVSSSHPGVYRMPAGCSSSSCVTQLGGGVRGYGVAVDSMGNTYLADALYSAVKEIPAGCTSSDCVLSLGSGFSHPQGIAVDGGGNLYVADTSDGAIKEIPSLGGSYGTPITLAGGFNYPYGVAVDGSGNVYVSDTANGLVKQIALATPPAVSFATPTPAGTTDTTDGTPTVTVHNIGNAPLTFVSPTPSIPAGFSLGTEGTACVQLQSMVLAADSSCTLTTTFAPLISQSGSVTGSISLTDNNLNQSNAQQAIPLSGTAAASIFPALNPYFNNPTTIPLGGTIVFNIGMVDSSSTVALASFNVTATLPAGLQVVPGTLSATCSGTVSYTASSITFSGVTLAAGGSCLNGITLQATGLGSQAVSVAATASGQTGPSAPASVSVLDVPASLEITGTPASAYVGGNVPFTVTALDAQGNPDLVYTGTVVFTSSDTAATLPGSATLANGTGNFTATFNTVGNQTITATDSGNSLSTTAAGMPVSIPNLVVTTLVDDAGTAANCTVQSAPGTGTDAACSLRDAMAEVQSLGSGNITFAGSTYSAATVASPAIYSVSDTLASGQNNTLIITGPTDGSGNNLLAIDGGHFNPADTTQVGIFGLYHGRSTTLNNLTLRNGNAPIKGGAIYIDGGTVTVADCTLSGNRSRIGGAIAMDGGALTLTSSTLSGNSASGLGGGISVETGALTVTNSTLVGNSAGNPGGGGLLVSGGTLTVTNVTFSGNSVNSSGNDIVSSASTTAIYNSIVPDGIAGQYTGGGNITSNSSLNLSTPGYYGGPAQTLLPLPGSTAICAGTQPVVNSVPLATDQRGVAISPTRYGQSGCYDVGAVQTGYGVSFTAQPPKSLLAGQTMSPAPAVTVTENGVALTAGSATVNVTDTASPSALSASSTLTASSSASAATAGEAGFSNLVFSGVESSDGLIASLQVGTVAGSGPAVPIALTAAGSTFAVLSAAPTITTPPVASPFTYGHTLAASTLSGGSASVPGKFAFTTPSITPNAGTASQSVTFTPASANSSSIVLFVSVTVNQAKPILTTPPTASAITFGQTLASSTLYNGCVTVAGKFTFATPATAPGVGTASQSVIFTPTSSNYSGLSLSVPVTVNPAKPTLTTPPTASVITYGQTLAASTLTGGAASVPGKFTFTSPTEVPSAGTGNYKVTFTPADSTEYSSILLSVSVMVNQAKPTITTPLTASAITYGQTLASSTLTGAASVPGKFAFASPSTAPRGGTASQGVTFTPTDRTDYTSISLSVAVTVNQAKPALSTPPAASAIAYGQTLASSTLTGGVASVYGKFAFTTPSTAPGAGTASQSVTFTPTDSIDYSSLLLSVTLPVNKASTTTSDTVNTTQTVTGTTATITATVKPQIGGTPTGTITYLNGSTSLGSAVVGTPFTTPVLPAGSDRLTAVYSGDSNFTGSTSGATLVTSVAPSAVQFLVPGSKLKYPLTQFAYSVNVALKNSQPTTGTITLYDGNAAIATYGISPLGVYLGITPKLAVGNHSLNVVYKGDSHYPPGRSAVVVVTVVGN